jgi:multidrug efflux system membrane fusion protein
MRPGIMQRSAPSRRVRGWTRLAGLLALIAIIILALWLPRRAARPAEAAADAAVPVEAAVITPRDVRVIVSGLGSVTAFNSVTITPQVSGQIVNEPYREGQEVKKGQLLVRINPAPYQAALDQALAKQAQDQATLQGALDNLKRYASLIRQDYTSRQTYDNQAALVAADKAQITADRAAVEAAKVNLGFTRIVSPVDGRLGLKLIDAGNVVSASTPSPIVTVMQIHPITVVSTLPQQDLSRVIDAMRHGKLTALAYDGGSRHLLARGSLLTINNQVDAATGTFQLKSVFPNQKDRLWPGRFVTVKLVLETLRKVPAVPANAVQRGPDGYYLYAIQPDNRVRRLPVSLRQNADGIAVIAKGAAAGTRVVDSGAGRLDEGSPVEIVTHTAPAR